MVKRSCQNLFGHEDATLGIETRISRLGHDIRRSQDRQEYTLGPEIGSDIFFAQTKIPLADETFIFKERNSTFCKLPAELRQTILLYAFQNAMEEDIESNLAWNRHDIRIARSVLYIFWRLCWDPEWARNAPQEFVFGLDQIFQVLSGDSDQRGHKILTPSIHELYFRLRQEDGRYEEDLGYVVGKCMQEFEREMEEWLPEGRRRKMWDKEKKRFQLLRNVLFQHIVQMRWAGDELENFRG